MTPYDIPPQSDFRAKTEAFLSIATESVSAVSNLNTRIHVVGTGDSQIPVSVNFSEADNDTWVCSPYSTYGRYLIEELDRWGHRWLTQPLGLLCRGLRSYLRSARIDDTATVNNWLLSTNLYPAAREEWLRDWLQECLDRWPHHALWFRSLNSRYTREWLQALQSAGFILIPSRQVYLYDRIDLQARKPHNLRWDLARLRAMRLRRSPATEWCCSDFDRAAALYGQLYLEKYSRLNPMYSAQFLRLWQRAGLLELTGLRDESGILQAVVGLFALGETITAPIVGYATERPLREGLYRLLMAAVFEQAALRSCRINLSAGAAHFKRLRGGLGTIEYSAVYVAHLPRHRQRAIHVLSTLARRIGEPCMRRFEL